jgi:signal transduction histidine kinase
MFSTLRSRLWLSYAVLILTALCIVAAVLFLYSFRNPVAYRQVLYRLKAVQTIALSRETLQAGDDTARRLDSLARAFNVRLVLFSQDRQILIDTHPSDPPLQFPTRKLSLNSAVIRDSGGKLWLYEISQLPDQTWLLIAEPRPRLSLLAFLTDEFLPPFLQGGAIALLLSLLAAYLIARWIADPLQEVVRAARGMPSEKIEPVVVRGPHEVQDLTRAFNAMAARVQSSRKSQRDFVANVSHELKTPLTSIQGFAQAIMDGTADTPEALKQAAEVIQNESARMQRMVFDLLDLARLDAGTADLKMASVEVGVLLRAVAEKFLPLANKAGVEISVSAPADLPVLFGDGDRLSQVFTNLVDNALKFTPAGGSIHLQAALQQGEMQILVSDTGRGIPASALPHVFERFYQADASRPGGKRHGAGLGLAIVLEIVQAHGGRISVRSREGQGTTFIVNLPLARSSAATAVRRK